MGNEKQYGSVMTVITHLGDAGAVLAVVAAAELLCPAVVAESFCEVEKRQK